MATVTLRNVTKRFGRNSALEDVSFHAEEGEFFTLFGPSGAGKTTTLELIAGIKSRYAGEILIGDRNVGKLPLQERNVAMAFENYALYPHMTVIENIAFPLRSPRAPRRSAAEILRRATEAAEQLGIGHLLDRNPVQLSGGQKQRVSLARALVREPDVFLLDEPIAHLDAKLRTSARANLKDIAHRLGTTIIYVTHDYREALGLSDRICILREGRVEQLGRPREIYASPASDFVAHLIGDPVTNLIDGAIAEEGGALSFVGPRLALPLPEACRARLNGHRAGSPIRLGIRPRDVHARVDATDGIPRLPVYGVEHTAHSALIHVDLGPTILTAEAPYDTRLKVGDPVGVEFALDRAHFFEKTFELSR